VHESLGVSIWWLLGTLGLTGIGQGMAVSPNQEITMAEVPVEYAGIAGGVMLTGQRVGTASGIAIVTAVCCVVQSLGGYGAAIVAGFAIIAITMALAGLIGIIDLARGRKKTQPQAEYTRA